MADTPDQTTRTDSPDVAAVRRRTFVRGTGVAATGALATGTAVAQRGRGSGREQEESDENGESDANEDSNGNGDRETDPDLIAHRGFAGLNPENTVGAVEAASRGGRSSEAPSRGADLIEIDVLPTADGDVVAFHDNKLAERDDGTRGLLDVSEDIQDQLAWKTDTETITDATVLGTDETVPLFTEVMDAIPTGVGVNVELKNPGSANVKFAANLDGDELATQRDLWRPFVDDVLSIVDDYNNEILFSSFYEAAIAVTREASDYAVAPLLWDSIDTGLAIARTYDAEAVHPPYNMIKGTPFFKDPYFLSGDEFEDKDLVEIAHEEGRDVNVYTLGTFYQAERLADAGVDGIIADYPDLLRFEATDD
jgi:glycerophosphoryl diester phosphodiesterase